MGKRSPSEPGWSDVKARLEGFDRKGLMGLIQDLYTAGKDNQAFLHTRLGLGQDILLPYKETIERWVWPDVLRQEDTSVAKAKQAISAYRKAAGDPAGLAELMVFFCECAAGFCADIWNDDPPFYDAMVRMFGQALIAVRRLPAPSRGSLIDRLDRVRQTARKFGYGAGDAMDDLFAEYSG